MKNLVVYYSLEGNTKFVAKSIAENIECDILELIPKRAYSSSRIGKYFSGGRSVLLKQKPELINKNLDLSGYKNIIIGTPVWCGTYAPPLSTLFSKNEIKYKNIALFACHGGGGAEKCFKNIKSVLDYNNFIGSISFKEPLKNDKEKVKKEVSDWITKIIK
ncbi:MAG: flavodoxin family protein [Clostridium sp.]